MKKHAVRWLVPFLKYGVGFGLLAFVISKYWGPQNGGPGIGQLLAGSIAFEWLAAAALLMTAAAALQIYRWYLLVRALDLPFNVRDAYRLSLVGIFYNTFIPGSVGGDLVKAYFIAHAHPERKSRAVASVIADRALGLFGLILFVAVLGSGAWAAGDPRINANPDLQRIVKIMAGVASASVLGFLLLGLLPERRVERFAGRLKWVPKLGNALAEMWYAVWEYRQRLKVVAVGVVLSAVSHFGLVFAFHCASRVFPPADPAAELATLSEHMVIAPIGFIAQAIPLAPGGVGVAEAVFAWLYKLSDRPETRGIIARLSLRLVEWLIALIGYLVFLRMRAEVRELQHEIEEEQEAKAVAQKTGEPVAHAPGSPRAKQTARVAGRLSPRPADPSGCMDQTFFASRQAGQPLPSARLTVSALRFDAPQNARAVPNARAHRRPLHLVHAKCFPGVCCVIQLRLLSSPVAEQPGCRLHFSRAQRRGGCRAL